ncbi:hypothetical protein U0C82_14980 [Fulvimarina sp. 2208YS6-2-32]|uniref:Uncharacterized protein n=1 Tax=Fulvimarina uroteuthidis TaxID=3098149 RepID=A0ABU5I4Z8_9HYPH|nr:hypothetical protein [Fulvimarina sp. 2208YS6-2-32]MDY8110444.1 hypothetical protein [Fulvimarina sp. 2208YS6-2-32]
MFRRELPRLDDETVLYHTVLGLLGDGLDRRTIEKALVRYAPVDLDLLASCYVKALRSVQAQATARNAKAA